METGQSWKKIKDSVAEAVQRVVYFSMVGFGSKDSSHFSLHALLPVSLGGEVSSLSLYAYFDLIPILLSCYSCTLTKPLKPSSRNPKVGSRGEAVLFREKTLLFNWTHCATRMEILIVVDL